MERNLLLQLAKVIIIKLSFEGGLAGLFPTYGMLWYGMGLYGMVWYDMVWCGMGWYGLEL